MKSHVSIYDFGYFNLLQLSEHKEKRLVDEIWLLMILVILIN